MEEPGTTESSKEIKAINKDSVHRLCSGQVILNLATAVKELVENSIDANANLVEVKLKDYGEDSIEVSDNGDGVDDANFEGLTAKYHTSKIREFADLRSVESFGFRGEALSSLCAMSKMTIITRHKSASCGTKLEFDHLGFIVKKTPMARNVGTTVLIQNLFCNLPVRKIEFHKNIKKQFGKMCSVVQAYGLISEGIRIICSNQVKGAKTTLLNTSGGKNIADNIVNVFGSKQFSQLTEIKSFLPESNPSILENTVIKEDLQSLEENGFDRLNLSRFKIYGFISKCHHGSGRSSKDFQFFYVNGRPCEPKNIIKLVNDVYHKYNVNQFPFVLLNVKIDRVDVDVNLVPDKRQVLFNDESALLLAVKVALIKTYEGMVSNFKIDTSFLLNKTTTSPTSNDSDENSFKTDKKTFTKMLSQWKETGDTSKQSKEVKNTLTKRKSSDEISTFTSKIRKMQKMLDDQATPSTSYRNLSDDEDNIPVKKDTGANTEKNFIPKDNLNPKVEAIKIDCRVESPKQPKILQSRIANNKPIEEEPKKMTVIVEDAIPKEETYKISTKSETKLRRTRKMITVSLSDLREQVKKEDEMIKEREVIQSSLQKLKFKSKIDPGSTKSAEEELSREINKSSFKEMQIIGQFNLGFIIVRLDDDLFIIDQHASDEKYNFETLKKSTVLQIQRLCIPQSLELTAAKEIQLMDHLETFKTNGFTFEIDENAPPTKKVKLVSKPFSQNWEFGKEDIDELLFMLEDAPPNTMCRPSRIRAMFASRACRKSVMIGTALNNRLMRKIVSQMGELDHPWHCPHGRPTLRHLINLKMLKDLKA